MECACGCGRLLTPRQVGRRTRYASLSCARRAYMGSPAGQGVAENFLRKAKRVNHEKFLAKVRAEVIDVCRDVLDGQEPTREMLIIAIRMRARGYHNGVLLKANRRQRAQRKREAA